MSRWPPDARDRLEAAALELFAENGYEETTVTQIADRAGLNRATFFRHFADKREVLFGGEDRLAELFDDGIRSAPDGATVVECLHAALLAAGPVMTTQQRTKARRRVRLLAANVEVRERGLLKHARISAAISSALRARGVDETAARLAAEVAMLAFSIAVEQWIGSDEEPFTDHATAALNTLQATARDLTATVVHAPEQANSPEVSQPCDEPAGLRPAGEIPARRTRLARPPL
jgi:AcrR family transcriptional regulator